MKEKYRKIKMLCEECRAEFHIYAPRDSDEAFFNRAGSDQFRKSASGLTMCSRCLMDYDQESMED